MIIAEIILGLLFLCAGRKLFWLSVGIMGFLAGVNYVGVLVPQTDAVNVVLMAVLFGILGAVLATAFQWFVVIVMGFCGGGYFLMSVFSLAAGKAPFFYGIFVVGGIVGALVMILAFDGALIVITALLGTTLIMQHLHIEEWNILFFSLVVLGVVVQYLNFTFSTGKKLSSSEKKAIEKKAS